MNGTSGSGDRLDRVERILENLGHRMDEMSEEFRIIARRQSERMDELHDEMKSQLKWQVVTQGHLDKLSVDVRAFVAAEAGRGERIDKLVIAIGELIASRK